MRIIDGRMEALNYLAGLVVQIKTTKTKFKKFSQKILQILRGNSNSLLVNGINEFSDFRAENYKLVVQLLINLCRCGESLAENVYLVFVRKYLEVFGVLFGVGGKVFYC